MSMTVHVCRIRATQVICCRVQIIVAILRCWCGVRPGYVLQLLLQSSTVLVCYSNYARFLQHSSHAIGIGVAAPIVAIGIRI